MSVKRPLPRYLIMKQGTERASEYEREREREESRLIPFLWYWYKLEARSLSQDLETVCQFRSTLSVSIMTMVVFLKLVGIISFPTDESICDDFVRIRHLQSILCSDIIRWRKVRKLGYT